MKPHLEQAHTAEPSVFRNKLKLEKIQGWIAATIRGRGRRLYRGYVQGLLSI